MKSRNKGSAAAASIGYTVGNYLIRGIGLITVPIFSRLLTTTDFGKYNTFLAYESILYILMGLTLNGSIKSAQHRFPGKTDEYTSSVLLMPVLLMAASVLIWIFAKTSISEWLKLDEISLLCLIFYSYASGLFVLYQSRISLDYDYREYLKLSLFNALFSVLLTVSLIYSGLGHNRYLARVIGSTLTYVIIAMYILHRLTGKARPEYKAEYWKYGLKLGVPLIPHGLSQVLLLSSDKVMINTIVGSTEAGIYSFAYTVFSLVQILATSLDTVYSTWVFKTYREEKAKETIRRTGTCFMLLIGGICAGTMLLAPEIIRVLGGEKYKEAVFSTIPVLLAGFFAMAYCVPAVMEYYHENTKVISVGTSIAALMNLVLNFVFIPRYGYLAAAYTTLASYIVYFVLHLVISRRISGFSVVKTGYLIALIPVLLCAYLAGLLWRESFGNRLSVLIVLTLSGCGMMVSSYGVDECKELISKLRKNRGGKR